MSEQMLDTMDLEREKGVTIKASAVRMYYTANDKQKYEINLIGTPGHMDFSYEVSRSLAACEGAVLVVDATQGIEAQTLANVNVALEKNLSIIPVINKIDLAQANRSRVKEEIEEIISLDPSDILTISAKNGTGVQELLDAIVHRIPPPLGNGANPLSALIFDSWYDPYQGVIVLIRVFDGEICPQMPTSRRGGSPARQG